MRKTDVLIIGAGPAGLTAGIYCSRLGLEVIVVDKSAPGGQLNIIPLVENYPGFPRISGEELARRFTKHAEAMGVEIVTNEEVEKLELGGDIKRAYTSRNIYEADALIIATGARRRKLNVPGEREFEGKGVSYCATCDGAFFRNKIVAVVGGANTAVSEALHLKELVKKLYIIHRRDDLRAEMALKQRLLSAPNVEPIWNTIVERIEGDTKVKRLKLKNLVTGESFYLDVDGVFIAIGVVPNSEIAAKAGVKVDENGYIIVDRWMRTNIKGVFAAGDVTGGHLQIATAVGEGVIAAMSAFEHVTGGWYAKRKKLKTVKIKLEEEEREGVGEELFKFKL